MTSGVHMLHISQHVQSTSSLRYKILGIPKLQVSHYSRIKKIIENHWPHGPPKPPTGHVRRKACVIQRRMKKAQSGPFWNGLIPSLTRSTDTPTYWPCFYHSHRVMRSRVFPLSRTLLRLGLIPPHTHEEKHRQLQPQPQLQLQSCP